MSSSASSAASGSASSRSSGTSSHIPNVVTIAGVDPSGGAGVFADLKAFSALGAYGCGVVAALTAQNTQAGTGVAVPGASLITRLSMAKWVPLPPNPASVPPEDVNTT